MNDLKVLVVDDESRMRKLVRDFLVKDGYSVVCSVYNKIWLSLKNRKSALPACFLQTTPQCFF